MTLPLQERANLCHNANVARWLNATALTLLELFQSVIEVLVRHLLKVPILACL